MSDSEFLEQAVALSALAPPSEEAFAVGCVIVDAGGELIATGFSRELGPHWHAEEVALSKAAGIPLTAATLYSSLEPCSTRKSRPVSCTQLIIEAGIPRVVFGEREPPTFVDCCGAELLAAAGIEVVEIPG